MFTVSNICFIPLECAFHKLLLLMVVIMVMMVVVCVYVCMCAHGHTHTWRSEDNFEVFWVLGIELRPSGVCSRCFS